METLEGSILLVFTLRPPLLLPWPLLTRGLPSSGWVSVNVLIEVNIAFESMERMVEWTTDNNELLLVRKVQFVAQKEMRLQSHTQKYSSSHATGELVLSMLDPFGKASRASDLM